MTRIGKFFDLSEFHSSDGAHVPQRARRQLQLLVREYLDPLREEFGPVTITSGYRTAIVNRRVGGASRSFHRYDLPRRWGVAADFTAARGRPSDWYTFLDRRGAGGLGLYDSFVHVDNRRVGARWRG